MKNLLDKLKIYGFRVFVTYILIDIKRKILFQMLRGSYSQQTEDLEINRILKDKKSGFYVDVGAYDPDRFSNTKMFYKKGWNGINIEPNTLNHKKFLTERVRDINLNIGVGNKEGNLTFYVFTPDTLSTFSQNEAERYKKQGYKLIKTANVSVKKLSSILKERAADKKIDFFSIDTEGFDLDVLQSNDWKNFSPYVICIEAAHHSFNKKNEKELTIQSFLKSHGYKETYSNHTNSIYVRH